MSVAPSIARVMKRNGRPFTVWQTRVLDGDKPWKTAGVAVDGYYPCIARHRRVDPSKLAGTLTEKLSLVVVDAATLKIVPAVGDRIAPGTITDQVTWSGQLLAWGGQTIVWSQSAGGTPGIEWRQILNVYDVREGEKVVAWRLEVSR